VDPDPFTLLWKSLSSKEQREKLENFIPVEYTNLTLDSDGFLYAVSLAAEGQDCIRRLNAADGDILVRSALGNIPVSGAVEEAEGFPAKGELSDFVDVTTGDDGVYYVLDSEYGRVYAYDESGNLLFVFGGRSTGQNGTFPKAVAIEQLDDTILVADSTMASITVFARTDYANAVFLGIEQYRNDDYVASIETWNEVLQYNRHLMLAYSKIGLAYYQMGEYELAMVNFETAMDQANYSKAYARYRTAWFAENFTMVILCGAGILALLIGAAIVKRRILARHPIQQGSVWDCLQYPLYVIVHPFDGFWDLKHEKRGRKWVATLLIVLTIVAFAAERALSGFAVSSVPDRQFDILYELKFVLIPLVLFLVGNISITTLMDGKGTFGQTYTAVGYTLTPLILIKLPLTLVSNWFTQSEAMYLHLFNVIAIVWTVFLLFAALMNTHEYTAGKTVATILITVVAMVIICFICVLFFSLFSKLVGFVYTLLQEAQYR
jgi:tetratricopeptide (TPR) repeat protein